MPARSPAAKPVTPAPTASTRPMPSCPKVSGAQRQLLQRGDEQVGMAQAAGFHPDEHFAGARFGDRHGGYRHGSPRLGEDGGGAYALGSHAIAACAALASPAAFQASKPPVTFITCGNPARRSRLAAMALRYPPLQCTATGRAGSNWPTAAAKLVQWQQQRAVDMPVVPFGRTPHIGDL